MGIFSEMDMEMDLEKAYEGSTQEEEFDTNQIQADIVAEPEPAPVSAVSVKKADESKTDDEDAKRKAHDEAEAQRKAEWEKKQQEKKATEEKQLQRISYLSDEDAINFSMKRISADTERLTRRNMKECISEYIQTLCLADVEFARKVLHPRKSMIHCIWYINREAREYVEQEMKDNDLKPEENRIYGCDVPDELCYQWAEDYFNDPDAKEDQEEEDKFIPKPYVGGGHAKSKGKNTVEKKAVEAVKKVSKPADEGQLTLGDDGMIKESA